MNIKSTASVLILTSVLLTGCSQAQNEEISIVKSITTEESPESATNSEFLYSNVEILENSATGSPRTYEELLDFISPNSANFFGFTITEQYTASDAYALIHEDFVNRNTTLFKAHINYDYLNNKEVDMDIYLAQAGTGEKQYLGSPLYGIGESYVAYFTGFSTGTWNVACPELLFAVDGNTCYQVNKKIDFTRADGTLIGEDYQQSVYTTTSNNPVNYTRKFEIEEITDFLIDDWVERGFTFYSQEEE